MKLVIALSALVAVTLALPNNNYYDSKYDNFDIDSLVSNKRLLKSYAHCFVGEVTCTGEGNNFKKVLPEAIDTTCGRCTKKQQEHIRKFIKALQEQLPEEWTKIVNHYDPDRKHLPALENFLRGSA